MRSATLLLVLPLFLTLSSASLLDTLSYYLFGTHTPESIERQVRLVQHLHNVSVVDHMQPNLPRVRIGHRVADLFNGWHFDDILQDAPDEVRAASLVAFYDSSDATCMKKYNAINLDTLAETQLPPRSHLFIARYDMHAAPRRAWYQFTPEMDLAARFAVQSCPEIIFVSRKCDGFTEWCDNGTDPDLPSVNLLGCPDFGESCVEEMRTTFTGTDLVSFVEEQIKKDGKPKVSKFLGSFSEQGRWMQKRDYTSSDNHFRNVYLAQAFPAFTPRGFEVVDTPHEVQTWLEDFVRDYEKYRKTEHWNAESTQMSFHEKPTTFIDMDRVRAKKERMAREYLQPLVEQWAGIKPLELTSFYGMREYHEGAWLKQHVDRIDTHVLSITLSVAKRPFLNDVDNKTQYKPWPLRVTDWTGRQVAYDHPAGKMMLYESSKLPHGRPTRNEGGIHLGCFVHFKPLEMHGADAKKWEEIASRARANQAAHTEHARYISTPEVDEGIEFSELNVGEASVWRKMGDNNKDSDLADGQFAVEIRNRADRPLQVFWYREKEEDGVFQGRAGPGAAFTLHTFQGHKFFWAEEGDEMKAVVGGKFVIDAGKKTYEYKLDKNGNPHKVDL